MKIQDIHIGQRLRGYFDEGSEDQVNGTRVWHDFTVVNILGRFEEVESEEGEIFHIDDVELIPEDTETSSVSPVVNERVMVMMDQVRIAQEIARSNLEELFKRKSTPAEAFEIIDMISAYSHMYKDGMLASNEYSKIESGDLRDQIDEIAHICFSSIKGIVAGCRMQVDVKGNAGEERKVTITFPFV